MSLTSVPIAVNVLKASPRISLLVEHAELAEQPGLEQLAADVGVLGRSEIRGEREILVDGLDAEVAGVVGELNVTGLPASRICPPCGGITPERILTSVLLPAPLSPIRAVTLPASTVKSVSRSTSTCP